MSLNKGYECRREPVFSRRFSVIFENLRVSAAIRQYPPLRRSPHEPR